MIRWFATPAILLLLVLMLASNTRNAGAESSTVTVEGLVVDGRLLGTRKADPSSFPPISRPSWVQP